MFPPLTYPIGLEWGGILKGRITLFIHQTIICYNHPDKMSNNCKTISSIPKNPFF